MIGVWFSEGHLKNYCFLYRVCLKKDEILHQNKLTLSISPLFHIVITASELLVHASFDDVQWLGTLLRSQGAELFVSVLNVSLLSVCCS